ncbi:GDNF-inducible zinc finger protein 1-like isoform X2 [Leguminivora glycinivorella]|uniref:GDNF-inducible zinc finger protein 1-like isoform X2 n=1 Tax=Leguminivora glycinivorella TaxID=1035111 RepID=UPI00200CB01B|nr:GDNF-inducible zinc finger protein 1-like isoform X2 [Leguminivora glycinivorella]
MAAKDHNFCCGCLNSDRKMIAIEDYWTKQCFLQILREVPVFKSEEYVPERLCWECEALLRRFAKFKQQVAHSLNIFQTYRLQYIDMKLPNLKPNLTINKLNNINIPELTLEPEITEIEVPIINDFDDIPQEDIKIEPENETNQIKSEIESHSDNDELLINYIQKKKKVKKRKKKPEEFREIELTETEIEGERREMESGFEYVHAMFRCEKCIIAFPNVEMMKEHEAVKHEQNAAHHKCPICTCSFVSEISYNYHANKHRRRYECCVCQARWRSKRAAQKHYTTTHGIEPNPENEQIADAPITNTNGVKSEDSFPCELCAKTFKWKTSLRKHLETHRIEAGQKRRPYCEPCKMSFTTTSNLQKHVKTSSKHQIQLKLRKLKDSLPEDSTSPEKQRAHIEEIKSSVVESKQHFPCEHCGKKFQWRGNLLRHLHSHTARANGELVCTPCNRTFSSVATYKQHMRLSRAHVSEQVFKSHTSLYLHKQVVHKKEHTEHLCDHCGKPFPNHAKLRSHIIALHTSESPYKCTSCAARFSWHSCLSRHVRRVHKRK